MKFATFLRNHGLVQHVQSSTQVHGGTLDLVLTRENGVDSLEVCDVRCEPTVTSSDHYLVSFTCTFTHQRGPQRIIKTGRKIKDIDIDCFKNDLPTSRNTQTGKDILGGNFILGGKRVK